MSKKAIFIILAAVLSLGAAAGVLYGVLTHEENTILKVCWIADEILFQEGDLEAIHGICEDPREFYWPKDQLPLFVAAEAYTGSLDEGDLEAAQGAMELANDAIGHRHFQFISKGEPDIIIVFGVPYEVDSKEKADKAPGTCSISRVPQSGKYQAKIQIRGVGHSGVLIRVIVHELGHCGFGLAHDDFVDSIMYPIQSLERVEAGQAIRFTDADRAAVIKAYYTKGQ